VDFLVLKNYIAFYVQLNEMKITTVVTIVTQSVNIMQLSNSRKVGLYSL